MKIAVIYNKSEITDSDVINVFGMRTMEWYSREIVEQVASSLEQGGHNVRTIEGNMHVIDELENFMPKVVRGESPGMVFNMAYGIQGQSRYTHIPSMLEMLGIPYIGSGPAAHAIALDKVMSKIVFKNYGLPTPVFKVFSDPSEEIGAIEYPVIVKPRMEAVSFGIRLVHNEKELREAISTVTRKFQQQALVEKFIPGREFGVSLLGNEPNLETLPVVEIDLQDTPDSLQTISNKKRKPLPKICPADISPEVSERLCAYARTAFNALGLYDFARVDFRMDPGGRIQILEINSMASLNKSGSFVQSAAVRGWKFPELVNRILEVAALRYFGKSCSKDQITHERMKKGTELLHVRLRRYLRSHLPTIIEYIEHMVSINNNVHNIEAVNTMGNWISGRLQQLGFQKQVYPQSEVGDILYFTNHEEQQNDILILAHLDSPYDDKNHVPFAEDRGRILGSGVTESKGGLAILITSLQALRFARALKNIRCGVLLTSDDSLGSPYSKELIADIAGNSRHVIGTKYGDIEGGIVTSSSGKMQYRIDISCNKNEKKKNITNIMEFVSRKNLAWLKLSSPQKGISVSIDSVTAQLSPGNGADHAVVSISVSYRHKKQSAVIDDQIHKIAEKGSNGGLQVRIREIERHLPVITNAVNRRFFERVRKLADLLEVRIESTHRETFSAIAHVPDKVPVLGGFGPLGISNRSSQEYIFRDSLIDRAALLALIIHDCAGDGDDTLEAILPAKTERGSTVVGAKPRPGKPVREKRPEPVQHR